MAKKKPIARNPLDQREAITPETIRPKSVTEAVHPEINQQGNKETSHQSASTILPTDEEQQRKPTLKRYATYLRSDSIKRIQYEAIDKDCSDYEIVQTIIDAYFEQAS